MTDSTDPAAQWRVDFDADIEFSNGGGLTVWGFRLDIPGEEITDDELGRSFIGHLGLLMVGRTVITRKEYIQEPHKGGRAVATSSGARRVVDLSGPAGAPLTGTPSTPTGLVDLPGVIVRLLGGASATVDRDTLAPFDLANRAVLIHADSEVEVSAEAARSLIERGAALLGVGSGEPGPGARALAEAGLPVVTELTGLSDLPPEGFRLHAVAHPGSGGTAAASVYGVVDGDG